MDQPRRRLHFLLPSLSGGGAERVFLTLASLVDRVRFAPRLILLDNRVADYGGEVPEDLPVTVLGRPRAREAAIDLVRHLHATRPHALFTTLGHMNLLLGAIRPLVPRCTKLIGRETNMVSETIAAGLMPRWARPAYRWLLPGLDHLVCQSAGMQGDLVSNFGYPAARTTVIPNPVDRAAILAKAASQPPPFQRADERFRLVAAGNLARVKGFDLLVEAVARCSDLPLEVDILGRGDERDALQAQIHQAGLGERILLRGFQANPYAWFAHADALVLSSRVDSFPNVVLESLACGTPVIALPAPGGIREILANRPECELADTISADALAAALRRWADRGPHRVPSEAVARYEGNAVVRQYESLLHTVIHR
jgi:glycosyltransferase involved in cell wall biosynthesis